VKPENPPTGFLIWRLSNKLRVAMDRALAPLGLTHAQYSLLASLYGMQRTGARPTQRQLADHTGMEPLYISKLARALDAAGLITRADDPADARAVRLELTATGHETVSRAIPVVGHLLDTLLAPLGGRSSKRTEAFTRDLITLLDNPLEMKE